MEVDEFDKEFFENMKGKELKLNKGQKRVLKFALKKGEIDLDTIEDLPEFLDSIIASQKLS